MTTFKRPIKDWGENSLVQGSNYDQNNDTYIDHRADDDAGQAKQDVEFIMTNADGDKLGKINVENGGHGSSTGLVIDGDGVYELWLGHDGYSCSGYVRFKRGESGTKQFTKTELPEGDIEIDQVNNVLVLRNNDSAGNRDRYRVYKLDTVRTNSARDRIKTADFYIPHWGKRWQGMYVVEGRLLIHRDVKTKGASRAQMFDLEGKSVNFPGKTQNWVDTTQMGDEAEGFVAKSKGDKMDVYVIKRTGPTGSRRYIEGTLIASLPKVKTPWDGNSFPGADAFSIGSRHPAVTTLGKRLEAHGWTGYKNGPGIPMSETDKAGVKWFQEKQGWTGTGADGIPGPQTWSKLLDKPTVDPDPKPEEPVVPKLASYYPPADRTSQWYPSIAGSAVFTKVDKLVLHTTEGSGWHNYGASGFGPHLTYHPKLRQWRQHIPLTKSATALNDPSSTPVRENRDNVIQIEIVGFAKDSINWSDEVCQDIAEFIKWLNKYGLPLKAVEKWVGPKANEHMSSSEWDNFKGVAGHQHVSGNDHWDPGPIDIDKIMGYAKKELIVNKPEEVPPPSPPIVVTPTEPLPSPPISITPTPAPPYMTDSTKFPGPGVFVIGSPHPAVAFLGERLVAHGWKYKVGPGTPMGTADVKGVQWFQGLQGWDGKGADGVPGKLTWEALLKEPKARPKPPLNSAPIHGTVTTGFKAKGGWAWSQGHPGEDWNAPGDDFGNDVFAVRSGIVKYIGRLPWDQRSGNSFGDRALVIQDDSGTYQTLYAHMSAVNVRVGQRVQVGDKVGDMGFSGNVIPANRQGTHLHVERRKSPYRYGTDVVKPVYGD